MNSEQISALQRNLTARGFFVTETGNWDTATASAWFSWASVNNVPAYFRRHQPISAEQTWGLLDSKETAKAVAAVEASRAEETARAEAERQRQSESTKQLAEDQAAAEEELDAEIAEQAAERESEQNRQRAAVAEREAQVQEEQRIAEGNARADNDSKPSVADIPAPVQGKGTVSINRQGAGSNTQAKPGSK
jgi:flagellar biosynthesis GTPase FlhF